MKRLAILFTSLVLSIPIIGCGGETTTTTAGAAGEDQSKWGEARKHKAKMEADQAERGEKARAKAAKKSP
jgi:hypothetical protein